MKATQDSSDEIPPELQVVVDTEILLEGVKSPVDHQKLETALAAAQGIESVSFLENKLAIRYDPERVTKARMEELIREAGFQISNVESASASPSIDPQSGTA